MINERKFSFDLFAFELVYYLMEIDRLTLTHMC